MMFVLIHRAASVVLVFDLAWAGTITYWRQRGSTPGGVEHLGGRPGLFPISVPSDDRGGDRQSWPLAGPGVKWRR